MGYTKTYRHSFTCDRCGEHIELETSEADYLPDGWFIMANNGKEIEEKQPLYQSQCPERYHYVTTVPKPSVFCLDCYNRFFSPDGAFWDFDEPDENYDDEEEW